MPELFESYSTNVGTIWGDLKDDDPDYTNIFREYAEKSGDPCFDYMSLTGSKI